MGDPARHRAEALHLLGDLERALEGDALLLGLLARRDLHARHQDRAHNAIRPTQRRGAPGIVVLLRLAGRRGAELVEVERLAALHSLVEDRGKHAGRSGLHQIVNACTNHRAALDPLLAEHTQLHLVMLEAAIRRVWLVKREAQRCVLEDRRELGRLGLGLLCQPLALAKQARVIGGERHPARQILCQGQVVGVVLPQRVADNEREGTHLALARQQRDDHGRAGDADPRKELLILGAEHELL